VCNLSPQQKGFVWRIVKKGGYLEAPELFAVFVHRFYRRYRPFYQDLREGWCLSSGGKVVSIGNPAASS
jgi:hypothetical protein